MAMPDPNNPGSLLFVSNTFSERFSRMISDDFGWLKIILPLVVLIGIFFIVKKYSKNKTVLIAYSVFAVIVYFLLLWLFSWFYFME